MDDETDKKNWKTPLSKRTKQVLGSLVLFKVPVPFGFFFQMTRCFGL